MFVTEKNMFSMKVFNEGLRGTLSIRNKRDVPLNYIKLSTQVQVSVITLGCLLIWRKKRITRRDPSGLSEGKNIETSVD